MVRLSFYQQLVVLFCIDPILSLFLLPLKYPRPRYSLVVNKAAKIPNKQTKKSSKVYGHTSLFNHFNNGFQSLGVYDVDFATTTNLCRLCAANEIRNLSEHHVAGIVRVLFFCLINLFDSLTYFEPVLYMVTLTRAESRIYYVWMSHIYG